MGVPSSVRWFSQHLCKSLYRAIDIFENLVILDATTPNLTSLKWPILAGRRHFGTRTLREPCPTLTELDHFLLQAITDDRRATMSATMPTDGAAVIDAGLKR